MQIAWRESAFASLKDLRFQSSALAALQEAAEAHLVREKVPLLFVPNVVV